MPSYVECFFIYPYLFILNRYLLAINVKVIISNESISWMKIK